MPDIVKIKTLDGGVAASKLLAPFLVDTSCGTVSSRVADVKLSRQLEWWSLNHLKDAQLSQLGRCQYPLQARKGKEAFDGLFSAVNLDTLTDGSSVSETFAESCWLVGYSSDMRSLSLAPNQAATIRYLYSGNIRVVLVNVLQLFGELKNMHKSSASPLDESAKSTTMEDVTDLISALTISDLEKLASHVEMVQCCHGTNTVLFVPQGWLILEFSQVAGASRATDGDVRVGIRKCFMQCYAVPFYSLCSTLLSNGGNDVSRMLSLLQCMGNRQAEVDDAKAG